MVGSIGLGCLGRLGCVVLLALVTACGSVSATDDDSPPTADAATVDGAPPSDAAPTGVRIEVREDLAPHAGAFVILHHADGTIAESKLTDDSGRAVFDGAGAVNLISVVASDTQIVTLFGVEQGDDILLETVSSNYLGASQGDVNIQANPYPNASYHSVESLAGIYATDGGTGIANGVKIAVPRGALDGDGVLNALAIAYNASGEPKAYAAGEGSVGDLVNVGPWREDVMEFSVNVSGVPPESGYLYFTALNRDGERGYYSKGLSALTSGGTGSLSAPFLGSFGDAVEAQVEVSVSAEETLLWTIRSPLSGSNITHVIDSEAMPPRVVSTLDDSDPVRPTFGATATGEASAGDAVAFSLSYRNPDASASWVGFAPPDTTSAQVPEYPSELADQLPMADSAYTDKSTTYVDLADVEGYASFRQRPLDYNNLEALPAGQPSMVQRRTRE